MLLKRAKFGLLLVVFQALFLILFGVFVEYDHSANAEYEANSLDHDKGGADHDSNDVGKYYPMFQDVHVMIFIGFGFLMTFLKRYGFGAVGLNMLVAAFVLQWSILFSGFFHLHDGKILVNITNLLTADFAAAAVLISYGALLGKASPVQLIVMAFIEIIVFTINEHIGLTVFKAVDVGGSMFVHAFGAYFGLAVSRILYNKDAEESTKEGSVYHSDLFSMIGTVFLWLYWPSFNSALAPGDDQHRAVINTYLALAACCVTTFAISSLLQHEAKLDMVHVQNATLAGGVAVGTSADMMINPWGAILIGIVAGTLSTVGYKFVTPFLSSKLKIHDTCGVNNLHGMPGVLAGIGGAVAASLASTASYGYSMYEVFPARAPSDGNSTELLDIQAHLSGVEAGDGRSASQQAGFQIVALIVTLVIAVASGVLTGLFLKLSFWDQPRKHMVFDDAPWWETPDDFQTEQEVENGHAKPDKLLEDTLKDEETTVA